MTELKPCPFCGCDDAHIDSVGTDGISWSLSEVIIKCFMCEAQTETFMADEFNRDDCELKLGQAVSAWNRRTPINKDQAIKDSLEQRNDNLRGEHEDVS